MRHRRWRLIVLPTLQLQIVLHQLLSALLFAIILTAAVVGPDVATLLSDHAQEGETLAAADRLLVLHEVVWPSVALGLLFLVGVSVVISHRIAGPLYRLRVALGHLRDGRVDARVRLRRRDLLKPEAELMTSALQSLHARIRGVRESHEELAGALRAACERGEHEALTPADLRAIEDRAAELDERLRAFHLEAPDTDGAM